MMLADLGKHWAEFSAEYKDGTASLTPWLELEEANRPAQVAAEQAQAALKFHSRLAIFGVG